MIKTYALIKDQSDKTERDDVEVIITRETTSSEDDNTTAGKLKAEIAKLDAKAIAVAEAKATLEAELAAVLVEAAKFELTIKE